MSISRYLLLITIIIVSMVLTSSVLAKNDVVARRKLVDKYSDFRKIRQKLEVILIKEKKTDEDMRNFFHTVIELNDDKSRKMTEALVDLLDFMIGEMTNEDIYQHISTRKKKVIIPLLKKKLSEKPLSSEKTLEERNEIIAELLRHIVIDVKYIYDETHFRPKETIKEGLYYAQIALEKYYYLKGHYPTKLSQAFSPLNGGENELLVFTEEGVTKKQKIKYQSFGSTYFICTLGEDGIFGTKDDIKPPYKTEIYSFP